MSIDDVSLNCSGVAATGRLLCLDVNVALSVNHAHELRVETRLSIPFSQRKRSFSSMGRVRRSLALPRLSGSRSKNSDSTTFGRVLHDQ